MRSRNLAISLFIVGAVLASVIFLVTRKQVPTFTEGFIIIHNTAYDQFHLKDVTSVYQLAKELSDRNPPASMGVDGFAFIYLRTSSGYFRVQLPIRGKKGKYGLTQESMVSDYPELNKIIKKGGWISRGDADLSSSPELSWTQGPRHSNIDVFRDGTFKPTVLAWLRRKLGL